MKIMSISISELDYMMIEHFEKIGLFPSKSETVRVCIRMAIPQLQKQINFVEKVNNYELTPTSIEITRNLHHGIMKKELDEFNSSQSKFYLVPEEEGNYTKFKLLKRV